LNVGNVSLEMTANKNIHQNVEIVDDYQKWGFGFLEVRRSNKKLKTKKKRWKEGFFEIYNISWHCF
jgi:predicted fused transcriptional regulator/phosphomethylpyrimidine kinase